LRRTEGFRRCRHPHPLRLAPQRHRPQSGRGGRGIDSFFAFGLFELARRSGFFPEPVVETFEPVIQEEGCHILFFVNWVAWHKRTTPLWRRQRFFLKTLAVWTFLIRERIGIAKDVSSGEKEDANFTVAQARCRRKRSAAGWLRPAPAASDNGAPTSPLRPPVHARAEVAPVRSQQRWRPPQYIRE
jgi:hypothetical protein